MSPATGLLCVPCLTMLAILALAIPGASGQELEAVDEQLLRGAKVGVDGPGLLEFFRLRCLDDTGRTRIEVLIRQLGSSSFPEREEATQALMQSGTLALAQLREAARDADLEVARRAKQCITEIERGPGPALPAAAARLLAIRKPMGAAATLMRYLPAADDESVEEEVLAALAVLSPRTGPSDPSLTAGLRDLSSARRGAAGFVLGRHEDPDTRGQARRLMLDGDVRVRLRTAKGLLAGREKVAVSALIDLLLDAPAEVAGQVEELLHRLAGEGAPDSSAGDGSPEARRQHQQAWAAWWHDGGFKVDLARLEQTPPLLGCTLRIEWNTNRVSECGRDGRVRWQLNVSGPMDAQVLPGNRVLIAEAQGTRVTERDFQGNLLWEHKVTGEPINCRRLPNGNTFVGTRDSVLEVTRAGQVVRSHRLGNGLYLHGVDRMPNGHFVAISNTGVIYELDAAGKEVRQVALVHEGSWGQAIAIGSGRYLVSNYGSGKIREVDAVGKVLWECTVPEASSVERLPNGHTVVGTQARVVEIDRQGKIVWEAPADGKVRRAHRR